MEPTTCQACKNAQTYPRSDEWESGCLSCNARALAVTGANLASRELQQATPEYLSVLEAMFGPDYREGAALVAQWADRIESWARRQVAI